MTVGVLYVLLVRFAVGNDQSARSKYCGPTGKRSAGKLACSVWSGGKAVRPYLSLLKVIGGALAAAECQTVGRRSRSRLMGHPPLDRTPSPYLPLE